MIIDKLHEIVDKKGPVCVGLDTAIEYLPESFLKKYNYVDHALYRFNERIIDATFDIAGCYKVQIAYYEALGTLGLEVYKNTLKYIREKGGIVIGDIKRGDIAATASMYAKAHFTGDFECDFVTLNPYMGLDSIEPYLKYVESGEKGIFALVRTSNKGAKDIQYIDSNGKKVYEIVGDKINQLGKKYVGSCGYSAIGGVVGCTHRDEAMEIRKRLDSTYFLIPGYGAQGGTAEDVALYMKNGNGGVVNSSRGILLAYKNQEGRENDFELCAREEVLRIREELNKALGGKENEHKLWTAYSA